MTIFWIGAGIIFFISLSFKICDMEKQLADLNKRVEELEHEKGIYRRE